MSLLGLFKRPGPSGFGYNSTAEEVTAGLDLTGKHVLVTGCNSGLGLESARVLAMRGATIIGLARTVEKATAALADLPTAAIPVACELSDLASVQAAVQTVADLDLTLDVLLCNAGIMALPELQQQDGYELQFFTNHVGHFVLVTGLLDRLADDGRVVMLSSDAHKGAPKAGIEFDNLSGEQGYSAWRNYGQSKLANLLFVRELDRRFQGTDQVAFAVHPGVIPTNLARHMNAVAIAAFKAGAAIALKTIPQGAATQCWAAVHPDAVAHSGEYLADSNVSKSTANGRDMDLAARLWTETERIVAEVTSTPAS